MLIFTPPDIILAIHHCRFDTFPSTSSVTFSTAGDMWLWRKWWSCCCRRSLWGASPPPLSWPWWGADRLLVATLLSLFPPSLHVNFPVLYTFYICSLDCSSSLLIFPTLQGGDFLERKGSWCCVAAADLIISSTSLPSSAGFGSPVEAMGVTQRLAFLLVRGERSASLLGCTMLRRCLLRLRLTASASCDPSSYRIPENSFLLPLQLPRTIFPRI